ncbi:helix-turn-helix domain-containing protein [Amaricoccus sp.]|uniref:helix-turn-helix domain-containing protein n=1 Tax=Amaricoccus sp. TaxID=1872485 RepID=UPI0026238828|nr:helix-turn-helix domain-containing protein [Amaricoccus sp.]HRO11510.1 helix-turn-helix domain-containing protein [Amaricoccus sp.]
MRGRERHADRVQAAVEGDAPARSALAASWRRSAALHRLDPAVSAPPRRLSDAELGRARQRVEPLLHVAGPALDRLFQAVGGVGCCVLLADGDGVPLDRRGTVSDDATFRDWGLWTGTVWSEAAEGTNGIGTSIVEQRALTIHRDQHFFARNTDLSCTTAPIFDHEGRLAAALDVSSCRADLTEAFVGLIAVAVQDAARRIEAEAFRLAFPDARVLVAPGSEKSGGGLIAVDRDDLVIGATRAARLALALTPEALARPRPAADLIGAPDGDLDAAERGALQRALARAGGNASAAARALGISRATLYRKLDRLGLSART